MLHIISQTQFSRVVHASAFANVSVPQSLSYPPSLVSYLAMVHFPTPFSVSFLPTRNAISSSLRRYLHILWTNIPVKVFSCYKLYPVNCISRTCEFHIIESSLELLCLVIIPRIHEFLLMS